MSKISKEFSSFAGKLTFWLFVATFILFGLHMLLQSLNWLTYHQQNGMIYELTNRFDLDDEASVATWFSQFLFLIIAGLAFLTSHLEKVKVSKVLWLIIGSGALLVSIDEVAGLHEFGLQMIHNTFFLDQAPSAFANAWLIILPIILVIAIGLIYFMYKTIDKSTVLLFAGAVGLFLFGAVGIDQITSFTNRESFLHQGVLVGLEELFEIISTVVIIYAVSRFLEKNHKSQIQNSLKSLDL